MQLNTRVVISAVTAAAIGLGNWATSVLSSDGNFNMVSIIVGGGFALMAMAKDIRSQLKLPEQK